LESLHAMRVTVLPATAWMWVEAEDTKRQTELNFTTYQALLRLT
jgi:hypothetical protein